MRIVIATTQIPFVYGGAEVHAAELCSVLRKHGHEAEIVTIPFKWYPPEKILDHVLACRLLDLTETNGLPIDLLIGLRFPAYLIEHPNKVLWILHQHRSAYELWDHELSDMVHYPNALSIRDAIREIDRHFIKQAKAVFANSRNVANRLERFCGIKATPLYHPPRNAEKFYSADAEDFFFFPSRLCRPKRQELVLRAMALTRHPVKVRFAGVADHPLYGEELQNLSRSLGVSDRATWLGHISEEEKIVNYAHALAIIYPPIDEDYGYVTLEAMLAAKPVITCSDSGGPLEFVSDGETGLIVEPTPESLAAALDLLWEDRVRARLLGERGRARYTALGISWDKVLSSLLS
ncbi:glycosyltransferase family 4 protein [Pyrinomonas methylaliphatogenes]|jgi:glycosyltransferase involved in cell wall biosynthesis|uniref:Glycosyltransferase n=1 Tax=Pyrinomonas methylaliphatogenes TaxID=454194 RepID=A0A0B6WYN2_9BACT|nr:glycosyltransferase family 4 protein [Pyrinomonas methylaliphatogenes]CDM65842.1 glycosyltransferase [Pyrinomonas methylaliphatogenes]